MTQSLQPSTQSPSRLQNAGPPHPDASLLSRSERSERCRVTAGLAGLLGLVGFARFGRFIPPEHSHLVYDVIQHPLSASPHQSWLDWFLRPGCNGPVPNLLVRSVTCQMATFTLVGLIGLIGRGRGRGVNFCMAR